MGIERVETAMGLVGVGAKPDLPTDAELVRQIVRFTNVLTRALRSKGPRSPLRSQVVDRALRELERINYQIDTFQYERDEIFSDASKKIYKIDL